MLPIEEKYDAATFERLKDATPDPESPKAWDRFMREVIVPERKRDIPQTP